MYLEQKATFISGKHEKARGEQKRRSKILVKTCRFNNYIINNYNVL